MIFNDLDEFLRQNESEKKYIETPRRQQQQKTFMAVEEKNGSGWNRTEVNRNLPLGMVTRPDSGQSVSGPGHRFRKLLIPTEKKLSWWENEAISFQ